MNDQQKVLSENTCKEEAQVLSETVLRLLQRSIAIVKSLYSHCIEKALPSSPVPREGQPARDFVAAPSGSARS